jgi:hypothetical protein
VGKRQETLKAMLATAGLEPSRPPARRPVGDLPSSRLDLVRGVYNEFGGVAGRLESCLPGPWDMAFTDGLIVEFDEEQHFNRYRLTALERTLPRQGPWADDYVVLCREREAECSKKAARGGYWASPPTERLFGGGDPPGVFATTGSPRWKQRALYDLAKDLWPAVRLARVATYDLIGTRSLAAILDASDFSMAAEVRNFVETRVAPSS